MSTTLVQDARAAQQLAGSDPRRALAVAAAASRAARRAGQSEAAAIAEQAWGHAALSCGDITTAVRHLRSAITHARDAGSTALAGQAGMILALALAQQGRHRAALAEADQAVAVLEGIDAARARANRGYVLRLASRPQDALAELDEAVGIARAAGNDLMVHRMLINRGLVHVDLNLLDAAEADLAAAGHLAASLEQVATLGLVEENLGLVATLRGDIPGALARLDRAEQILARHAALSGIYRDRAALFLSVGLLSEARGAIEQGIAVFRRQGRQHMVPEMWLLLAEAAYLERDWAQALRCARRARRQFASQHRNDRVERARLEVLRAELATGGRPRLPAAALQTMVDTMTWSESTAVAVEARLAAAGALLARGHGQAGLDYLQQARQQARRGPAVVRARGWYAEALVQLRRGDPRRAARAARTGLAVLTDYSAAMGASDLRAHTAVHRAELVRVGLRLALDSGRPRAVFEWAELGRASQLRHPPARPPGDAALAGMLEQLRAITRQLDAGDAKLGNDDLRRRQAAHERRIRDYTRLRRGDPGAAGGAKPIAPAALGPVLGDWALVEYVQLDGQLHALTMVDGRLRLHSLGAAAALTDPIAQAPFALHRLASSRRAESHPAAMALLDSATQRLDALLLRPLPEVDRRPLLVVPTAPLHSVPWAMLPSCAGRPVAVSPSATLWHEASTRPAPTGTAVGVAAAPGLAGARREAEAVAAIHGSRPLVDGAATVQAVLTLLSTATLVHLAAHGRLSPENPLFSSLLLADGPLVAYDLEQLPAVPATVVLAACDSGRSHVYAGDELLGLGATLIAQGTAQLVGSVLPIPDAETTPLMVAFHRGLAAGRAPARALSDAQLELRDASPAARAAAAGFVCLGCGTRPTGPCSDTPVPENGPATRPRRR